MNENHLDINYIRVQSYVRDKRPPIEIRHQLDIGFSYNKNTFEIFEVRPIYGSQDPDAYMKSSFAKFRYIKTQKIWKLYWKRASNKWVSYKPHSEFSNLDDVINCIEEDVYGCFYG